MNYRMIADTCEELEKYRAFTEADMKYIRLHAFTSVMNNLRTCVRPEDMGNLLGVSPQTVRNWAHDKKFECWRDGDGWWEIPLGALLDMKLVKGQTSEYIRLDTDSIE